MSNILEMFPFEINVLFLEQYLVETNDILNYLQVVPSMNAHFKANFKVVTDKINHSKYDNLPEGCIISCEDSEQLCNALREPQKFKGIVLMEFHDYDQFDVDNIFEAVHEQTIFRYTFYGDFVECYSYSPQSILDVFLDLDLNHRISHISFPDVEVLSPFDHLPTPKFEINFQKLKNIEYCVSEEYGETFCFNIENCKALETLSLEDLHAEFTFPKSFVFPKNLEITSCMSSSMGFESPWFFKSQWVQNLEYLRLEDSRHRHQTPISMIDLTFPKLKEIELIWNSSTDTIFQNFTADSLRTISISSEEDNVIIDGFRAQNIEKFTLLAKSCIIENFEEITHLEDFEIDVEQIPKFNSVEERRKYMNNSWSFLRMAKKGSVTRYKHILRGLEMVNLEELELLEIKCVSLSFEPDNITQFPSLKSLSIDGYCDGKYGVISEKTAPFRFNAPHLKFLNLGCRISTPDFYGYISRNFPELSELIVSYNKDIGYPRPKPLTIDNAVFKNLESLKFSLCERSIILSKCVFPRLKTLELFNNGKPIKKLELKLVKAPRLKELTIENYNILSIGITFKNKIFPKLKSIKIKNCQVPTGIEIAPSKGLQNIDVKILYKNNT
ncbi:hypothetical protein BN7_2785 [Wickerhamomyces ciferrii]|uniref:Internalin-I n=1 Tax=Wickerhamomyces ciferrii (strain ATCC 14091 / BCRC 22168 / CBS 111 / JCM 3599 / NBRC 0793 / NRRL Y-1031 F-60-10) TaxID=1206466 RepID=K0KPY3_WICCF|nr:uncharacterized protein BN7_2785 [Wickerhamomyces ciferrii]CCH43238.1 hypothetical protein BN7_2785 [Wickerhamomyces ciferrii]